MSDIDTQATEDNAPAAADTATTQPSEASTQTNEAPEATQGEAEAQGAEATEVKAEDTAGEKLYAGKYKSPEDMEKAYKELESKFGQTTSEKAELARILNEAFASPDSGTSQPAVTDDSFDNEPDPVNQEIEGLKRNTAIMSFIMQHPDADPAAMQKVLAEDRVVPQISGHDAKLEYAYLKSQNIATPKAIAEAEKQAAQSAQAKIVEKQTAQVEAGRKAEQTDENSELFTKATGNYSQEERDTARKAYIRKNLVNL